MKIRHQFGLFAFIFGTYLGFMYMFLTELEPISEDAKQCPPPLLCPTCLCQKCPECPIRKRNCHTASRPREEKRRYPCYPHKLVMTTFDRGGIGNKMSEYATLLAITTMSGYYPAVSQTLYDVLSEAFSNINHLPFNVSDECIDVVRYLDPGGDPKVVDLFLNKHAGKYPYIHLINYPNAVRVFHKMYHVLKHQFTFKRQVFELASQFVDLVGLDLQYEIPNPIFVGIHVRRIAYDHHLQITQNGSLVEVEYFKRAITALQDSLNLTNENAMNRMVFFVTSDDEKWCKRVFFDIEAVLFFPSDFYRKMPVVSKAHFDLCIMSLCNHSIYDYGTFGFWGAYLAGGHTILAHNIGSGNNTEVETIKQANLPNWHFIDAHPPPVEPKPDYSALYRRV